MLGFASDNRSLYLLSSVGANATRLMRVSLDTGASVVLAEDPDVDVSDVMGHPTTDELEAVQFTRARAQWVVLDARVRADFALLRTVDDGDFKVVSRDDRSDRTWIVRYVSDDRPARYYLYDRGAGNAIFLFSDQPALQPLRLAKTQPVSFTARDGLKLHGYLTLPVAVEPRDLALVLKVHGGPWNRDLWGFDPEIQWLANRGYAVLQVNFRGSSGYGKAYLNAGNREWGGKMHADLLDAKRWAVAQGYARPDKVCLMGGSYGGYAAMAALALSPKEFACGISFAGLSDLALHVRAHPAGWWGKGRWDTRVGNAETEAAFLESRSPLFLVEAVEGAILIVHGAKDPNVHRVQSDLMVAALRARGKSVPYLLLPDDGHGLHQPVNRLRAYALAEQVLARYLGGRAEPTHAHENAEPFLK